jgi:hypothetical protein
VKKEYYLYIFIFLITFLFTFGLIFGQYILKRDVWTGFYYPDKKTIKDYRTWIVSPPLYSLEECRRWVNVVRKTEENYDYQCGQGCRFTTKYGETTTCRTDTR